MAALVAIITIVLPVIVVYASQRFLASRDKKEKLDKPPTAKTLEQSMPVGPELFTKLVQTHLPRDKGFMYEVKGEAGTRSYLVCVSVYDPLSDNEDSISSFTYNEYRERYGSRYPYLKYKIENDMNELITKREAERMDGYKEIIT